MKHGAKRRICKYPGCEKNIKSKGLCSKHGPARKKCTAPKCSNVAVKGGKCKSHGAYATECTVTSCHKQAEVGGLCISHYKEMNEAKTQHSVLLAQMSQLQGAQGVQGVQLPVAGLAAMNPAMNLAAAAGLMPLQMQGMGMPMSMPFIATQTGMLPNQMIMPSQMRSHLLIPSQIQLGVPYPVNGLTASMQVRPAAKSRDDAGLSQKNSSKGQATNRDEHQI